MGNCESRDVRESRSKTVALPPLALFVEAFVAPATLADPSALAFAAVSLDGRRVESLVAGAKAKRLFKSDRLAGLPSGVYPIPSGPVELPARPSDAQLQLTIYIRSSAEDDSADIPEGIRTPVAELSVPLSDFVRYGAPLYCSLWLGLTDSGTHIDDDVKAALRRARCLGVPKVKVTLFRPSVPLELLKEPSCGIQSVEPNVKGAFAAQPWWEPEVPNSAVGNVEQVEGLIRSIEESNAVIHAHEREQEKNAAAVHSFKAVLETIDSKRISIERKASTLASPKRRASYSTATSSSQPSLSRRGFGISAVKGELDRLHEAVLKRRAAVNNTIEERPIAEGSSVPDAAEPARGTREAQLERKVRLLQQQLESQRVASEQRHAALEEQHRHKVREAASATEQVERLVGEVASLRKALSEVTSLRKVISEVEVPVRHKEEQRRLPQAGGEEPEPENVSGCLESDPRGGGAVSVQQKDAVNWLKELERVELALVEERQRCAALLEEKQVAEAAHQRDVAALEEMLQALLEELAAKSVNGTRMERLRPRERMPMVNRSMTAPLTPQGSCTSLDSRSGSGTPGDPGAHGIIAAQIQAAVATVRSRRPSKD